MDNVTQPSRRQFLKYTGIAGAASMLPACQTVADPGKGNTPSGRPKNLIFLMVDGLCNGTLGLAHHWKLRHEGTPLNWMQLFDRDDLHRSFQDTASASSPVTDSAAAATSWGSGQRVNNGSINVDVNGNELTPILTYAKNAGMRTGLVTTCRVTHATPAGFTANSPDRNDEDLIASQYYERGVDLILGGGARHFNQLNDDGSSVDYVAKFEEKGYQILRDRSDLQNAQKGRLLGLFSNSHVPYAIDRKNDSSLSEVPSLVEMFEAALKNLHGAEDGFILQVEGGRVDHAGHGNDAGAILHEFLDYDACIPVALEYIEKNPETMLIITTDHGTGGCQLDGQGDKYSGSGPALDRINGIQYSYEWLQKRFSKDRQFDAHAIKMAFGIDATPEQAAIIQSALDNEDRYLSGALNRAFGKQLNEMTAVGWSSGMHTSECVDFFSFGPGADTVPAFIQNREVFGIMANALGLETES